MDEQAVLVALLAACAFALGSVLQQKGTLTTSAGADDPRFLVQLLHQPIWIAGALVQMSGWILQGVALDTGSVIVVQSVCALSLVLVLPLGVWLTDQVVTRGVVVAAAATVVGIVVFLSFGVPQTGTSKPTASVWLSATCASVIVLGVLSAAGLRRSGSARAALFGAAAGVSFAFQATVTKVFVSVLPDGLEAVLRSWTTYALVVSALIGFVLQQSALKTGALAAAMASSNASTLFGSVAFGSTVFGETLAETDGRLAPAYIGLAIALWGVVHLAVVAPGGSGSNDVSPGPAARRGTV